MTENQKIIPVYTTKGDLEAYLLYPHLYSRQGEWIGVVASDRQVYSVHGHYVGWLGDGPRVLRKMADSFDRGRISVPRPKELKIRPPALSPLAPMMSELTFGTVDVLQDQPELLPSVDFGEMREDMD